MNIRRGSLKASIFSVEAETGKKGGTEISQRHNSVDCTETSSPGTENPQCKGRGGKKNASLPESAEPRSTLGGGQGEINITRQ